jgi:hypothetical protein
MIRWNGPVIATVDMFVSLMVAAFVLMADPAPKVAVADKPICQMAIDATWQGDLHVDVDLWVRGPSDTPVGYSAKDGGVFNLVRDDLGILTDHLGINAERACASGLPDGEYVVNLHLYNHAVPPPINVGVVVSMVDAYRAQMSEVVKRDVVLTSKGQELTVVRFTMKAGKLVEGSEHDIPVKLRHGSQP